MPKGSIDFYAQQILQMTMLLQRNAKTTEQTNHNLQRQLAGMEMGLVNAESMKVQYELQVDDKQGFITQLEVEAQLLRQSIESSESTLIEQQQVLNNYMEGMEVSERIINNQEKELQEVAKMLLLALDNHDMMTDQLTVADA